MLGFFSFQNVNPRPSPDPNLLPVECFALFPPRNCSALRRLKGGDIIESRLPRAGNSKAREEIVPAPHFSGQRSPPGIRSLQLPNAFDRGCHLWLGKLVMFEFRQPSVVADIVPPPENFFWPFQARTVANCAWGTIHKGTNPALPRDFAARFSSYSRRHLGETAFKGRAVFFVLDRRCPPNFSRCGPIAVSRSRRRLDSSANPLTGIINRIKRPKCLDECRLQSAHR